MKLLRQIFTIFLAVLITLKIFGGEQISVQISIAIGQQKAMDEVIDDSTSYKKNIPAFVKNAEEIVETAKEEVKNAKDKASKGHNEKEEDSQKKTESQTWDKSSKDCNRKEVNKKEKKIQVDDINSQSSTEDRIRAINNYLVSQGFTPEAAAGVIGNVAVESTFDPSFESRSGYVGLFQWNTNSDGAYWWYAIEDWMIEKGFDSYSFEGQVKAFIYGPKKGQWTKARLKKLKKMEDVHQATEFFAIYYEGCEGGGDETEYYEPGNCYQALNTRKEEAIIAYEICNEGKEKYDGEKEYNC